jgi:cytoskeletal protein CcmA (bactofilin family)
VNEAGLVAWLGQGGEYEGDVTFQGRVRIDGVFSGKIRAEDLVEIGPGGRVDGEIDALQVLVAGRVDGLLRARERCTLLDSAVVEGQVITPWLDVRLGARLRAEVITDRERSPAGGST